jgi:hypothetical protein
MRTGTWIIVLSTAALVSPAAAAESQAQEQFLRSARVVHIKALNMGVTGSLKATLHEGETTHAAHVQTVDESRVRFDGSRGVEYNFRDTYKFNIAAYELARLLGLDMVPVSVPRKVNGQQAAVTWWIDDASMTELERRKKNVQPPNPADWNRQLAVVKVFDELIFNTDRNLGNLVITSGWKIHMIDHTRAFRMHQKCPNLKSLGKIDRDLLDNLRTLDSAVVRQRLGGYLTNYEIKALLARRDQIVQEFESRIQAQGEQAVFYQAATEIQ